jgi:hypothetical protein
MKHDMNLIRLLLLQLEGGDVDLGDYSEEEQVYNSSLLIEAGLVHGMVIRGEDGHAANTVSCSLAWAGHDFLDAARSESVWNQAWGAAKSKGLSLTFELLKWLLVEYTKQQLKVIL